mgnify:CR=1 FL=1
MDHVERGERLAEVVKMDMEEFKEKQKERIMNEKKCSCIVS